MGIGSGTAMMIGGLASGGGSLLSGFMGSNAAENAAAAQQAAAEKAAQFQQQQSQNALNYQENEFNNTQSNLAPYLQAGTGALSNLNYLMGITPSGFTPSTGGDGATLTPYGGGTTPLNTGAFPGGVRPTSGVRLTPGGLMSGASGATPVNTGMLGSPMSAQPPGASVSSAGGFGSLMQPYGQTFQAPTGLTEQNDPGYQARLNLGRQAMEQSAAARGGLLTGGTLQAENQLAQDYASNEYGNVYNRALNTFGTNYNVYNQNQANQFNRLMAMSGQGQSAADTLGALGQSAASGVTGNLLGTGQMVGNDYTNAGNANASGIMGSANAWANGIGGFTNSLSNLGMMQALMGGGGGGGYQPYSWLNGTADPLGLGGAS